MQEKDKIWDPIQAEAHIRAIRRSFGIIDNPQKQLFLVRNKLFFQIRLRQKRCVLRIVRM